MNDNNNNNNYIQPADGRIEQSNRPHTNHKEIILQGGRRTMWYLSHHTAYFIVMQIVNGMIGLWFLTKNRVFVVQKWRIRTQYRMIVK